MTDESCAIRSRHDPSEGLMSLTADSRIVS